MAGSSAFELRTLGYSEILQLNKDLAREKRGRNFTIDFLSNVTVNPIKEILELYLRSIGLDPVINFGNYDNIVQDSFSLGQQDAVIVFYEAVNFSEDFDIISETLSNDEIDGIIVKVCGEIDLIFNNLQSKPLVLFNKFYSGYFTGFNHHKRNLDRITDALNEHLIKNAPSNVQLIDIARLVAQLGHDNVVDKKKFTKYKSLYKIDFFKTYVAAIENLLLRRAGKLKKALIFDCDNTLWKGILGEDGPEGIDMSAKSAVGRYYNLVQKIAVELSRKGVLICLCSKNNTADVDNILATHPDMVLKNEHIVASKVNWSNKDENLASLAEELNIGLDSFVFVDDSEFEISLIKSSLPDIVTVHVPKDPSEFPGLIWSTAMRYFNLEPLKEDLKKVRVYKEQAQRTQAQKEVGDIDSYLSTLGTKMTIAVNDKQQVARIAQLTQKTNQFNLTTKRYSEAEIQAMINSGNTGIFTVDVSDRFGDSGVTGVIIVEGLHKTEAEIDTYLLSCRVLGRKIEQAFLDHVLTDLKKNGVKKLKSKYIKTNKNAQVKDYYDKNNFQVETSTDIDAAYSANISDYTPAPIKFIEITKK